MRFTLDIPKPPEEDPNNQYKVTPGLRRVMVGPRDLKMKVFPVGNEGMTLGQGDSESGGDESVVQFYNRVRE